jgi:hypothetical protein
MTIFGTVTAKKQIKNGWEFELNIKLNFFIISTLAHPARLSSQCRAANLNLMEIVHIFVLLSLARRLAGG